MHFITTAWCPSDFEDGYHEHVSTLTVRKQHTNIPAWFHFCLKVTKNGVMIIGELFAKPVAKHSHKSRQKKYSTCVSFNTENVCTAWHIADKPCYSTRLVYL